MRPLPFPSASETALRSVRRNLAVVEERVAKAARFSDLLALMVLSEELAAEREVRT